MRLENGGITACIDVVSDVRPSLNRDQDFNEGKGRPFSGHDEAPFVDQDAHAVEDQLAGKCLLAVHKVADEDEEHDEDVEMHERCQEEVVGQEQEGLCPVPALDGADDACCFDGACCVGGPLEPNSILENRHLEQAPGDSPRLEMLVVDRSEAGERCGGYGSCSVIDMKKLASSCVVLGLVEARQCNGCWTATCSKNTHHHDQPIARVTSAKMATQVATPTPAPAPQGSSYMSSDSAASPH